MDIHTPRLHRSHAVDLAELDDAEQLRLGSRRESADFVEEQRAAVGELEKPGFTLGRAEKPPRT